MSSGTKPRERPILMNKFSVRGILDGLKTQTRRVIRPQPKLGKPFWRSSGWIVNPEEMDLPAGLCPYGMISERLWVRETWAPCGDGGAVWYRAGVPVYYGDRRTRHWADYDKAFGLPVPQDIKWRPSIFMPRWACRLLLDIKSVQVEQVQDISEKDAIAEGFPMDARHWMWGRTPQAKFKDLWNRINAKRGYGWEVNPWVWAITFEALL